MAHHQLFEWERRRFDSPTGIPLDEAGRLVRAAAPVSERLKGKPKAFDFGREDLAACNLVGIIAAGDASCEILPKIDRHAGGDAPMLRRQLVRMLGVAHDVPVADGEAAAIDHQHETILEILIARFAALLGDAARRGMPRAYVAHTEDLPALRGRLDVTRQFTVLAASPHRLASRFDEFSDDIPLNQVMKAAVTRLRLLARGQANQRRLAELALLYADVRAVPRSQLAWHAIVPDRSNARWMTLVRLARLILGDRFQNSAHGAGEGFALLFDMNELFERYVAKLLDPIAREHGLMLLSQKSAARHCLHPEDGADPLFATIPDIQLRTGDRAVAIVDTKWKRLVSRSTDPKMDVSQPDIYQMMAYAQLYRCEQLVLLYPHHGGVATPMPVRHWIGARGGPASLTIATIDLSTQTTAQRDLLALTGSLKLRDEPHGYAGRFSMEFEGS